MDLSPNDSSEIPPAREAFWIRKPVLTLWLTVGLIGLLLYSFTWSFPFHFDGQAYIVNNPLIRSFDSFSLMWNIPGVYQVAAEHNIPLDVATNFVLRPVTYLTFAINYAISGLDPRGFRAVNLLLHCANALLVFHLLRLLLSRSSKRLDDPISAIFIPSVAALLFLVHPLQTESVTYIAQRFTSLGAFFYLLTLLWYFRADLSPRRRTLWRLGALLAIVAGLLSKEEAFTVPFMLVLIDWLVMGATLKRALWKAAPFFVCLIIVPFLLVLLAVEQNPNTGWAKVLHVAYPDASTSYSLSYALTELRVVLLYLTLLLFPKGQNVDWDVPMSTTFTDYRVWLSVFAIALTVFWAWNFPGRKRGETVPALFLVFVLWFFITLAVSSSFAPLPDVMAEHRAYLASVGFAAVVAAYADVVRRMLANKRVFSWLVPAGVGLCLALLSHATIQRNGTWRNHVLLWADAAGKSPAKARPWVNLSIALVEDHQPEIALECLERAFALKTDEDRDYSNLAGVFRLLKRYDDAINACDQGIHGARRNLPMLHFHRALAAWSLDRKGEAIDSLQQTVTLAPKLMCAHAFLAQFYADVDRLTEAIEEYKIAFSLDPRSEVVAFAATVIQSKQK